MALPTRGRVIIETTVGEVDMELWSKVRWYDSLMFHVFIIQLQYTFGLVGDTENMSKLLNASYGRCGCIVVAVMF